MGIPVPPRKRFPWGMFAGSVLVIGIGAAAMSVIIRPINQQEHYKRIQQQSRANVDIKKTQPGEARIWSNPFEPKKDDVRKDM